MSTWIAKLKEAKELFDNQLISEGQYNQLRDEAFALRDAESTTIPAGDDDLSGETQMFTEPPEDDLGSDTLAGVTQFVSDSATPSTDPAIGSRYEFGTDTLAGSTQFVPDFDMDAGNDTLSGVTMMGRAVTLTDANIETLSSGTLFNNRYSILKLLGKGGMGVVYKAVDIHTGADVAVKVLRNHVKDDASYIQSLKDEVARGLRWNHPSFLQIRHLEVESVQPFVVMELMDRDAKEWLDSHGGQVESKEVLSVVQSITSALRVMHEDGHIHLDLKPENVLLNGTTAKLADFGISSSLKDQRGGHSGSGTLFYAPPEQMDGGQCDVRTDIYALGMMTGQLLSGRFPFALKRAEEVQAWHRSGSRDFGYLPGKVAQVLGKACAVSMNDRYRTVVEFIGELEKALDHKPWYPPSLPLESVHPSVVLVNDEEYTMDVASLLPQGVLTPSLTLKGGKVLMQSNPFALAEIGVLDYLTSELKPVVQDILSGSDSKLSGLSKQDATTEAHLAMLASRAELLDRTTQRRLYYASDSLESLEDRLTLAYTHRMAMKDAKAANDLMESIQPDDIFDRLEVARHQRWLELDQRGVQRKMFAIEEDCKTSEDWEGMACAQVSLFGDWNSADSALTRANQKQPSNLQRSIETLQEQVSVFCLRNPLKEAGVRLDHLADSPADYAKIAEFWKAVGAGDAASKAEEERQALFRSTVQGLVSRLAKLDAHIALPSGTLSESDVVGYERKVREQERLHGDVGDLKRKLSKTDVTLTAPTGVLTEHQVNLYKEQVSEQVGLYQQVQEMAPIARSLNLEEINWTRPYTVEQVNQRREEIATYAEYAEQMQTMLATANQLGWDVSQSGRVEAENVSTFAEQLAEQQRLSEQLGKLRAEAEALGGTLRLPEYPLTVEKIAGVEAQMPSVRVEADVREQVSLAKSIGWDLEMPTPPYTLEMVEGLRERVVEQQGFKTACENDWGLKHPRFPMTQGDVETFKASISQQATWDREVESLFNQAQSPNRPKPPYTEREVEGYRQATNAILSRRRNIKLAIGSVTAIVLGFVGFQWNEAQSLGSRVQAIGWDIDVPVFDHGEFVESVPLQESLSKRVLDIESRAKDIGWDLDVGDFPYLEEQVMKYEGKIPLQESLSKRVLDIESRAQAIGWDLDVGDFPYSEEQVTKYEGEVSTSESLHSRVSKLEKKHGIRLGFPYSEKMLDGLEKMAKAGRDLSTLDFSKIDVEKWKSLQSLLKVQKIPGGTFTMGCTSEQSSDCDDDEKPSHTVTITHDFYMMESEVTQALYETVMGSNPSNFKGAKRPVETVSWIDAASFANRLSALDGREPCYSISGNDVQWSDKDCTGWRLPTEAEWEYAARGGQSYTYAGSNSVGDVAWYGVSSGDKTHDVCGKKRNGYGLCDMSGNVYEWVWDIFGDYSSGSQTDPAGPDSGPRRVYRGGGWDGIARGARVSYRNYGGPAIRGSGLGFRLSRNP